MGCFGSGKHPVCHFFFCLSRKKAWLTTYGPSTFPPELNSYNQWSTKAIIWVEIGPDRHGNRQSEKRSWNEIERGRTEGLFALLVTIAVANGNVSSVPPF
jgi:hypothetical protein